MKRSRRLVRRVRLRARSRTNAYRRRPRDFEHMRLVRKLPCSVRAWMLAVATDLVPPIAVAPPTTTCEGRVQADHAGKRGLGQKATDDTCIPLCAKHHEERTDVKQTFRGWTKIDMRSWCDWAIVHTRDEIAQLKGGSR